MSFGGEETKWPGHRGIMGMNQKERDCDPSSVINNLGGPRKNVHRKN